MENIPISLSGIGQDSHKFTNDIAKPLILAGVTIPNHKGLLGNSDSDVVLHAICNAVSSITCQNVLGNLADKMCKEGIKDSSCYLLKALEGMNNTALSHIAISIECKSPKISPYIDEMRASIASITKLNENQIGITATTGEGLTSFGQGLGIQVFAIVSAIKTN